MVGGPLTFLFIVLLLVALAVPVLRLIMSLVILALLGAFLWDVFAQDGVWTAILVDELVIFAHWFWAAFDAFMRSLPR